jgi:hypothetical protein
MRVIMLATTIGIALLAPRARAGELPPLVGSPQVQSALAEALDNPDSRARALRDPVGYLNAHGVEIPEGVDVDFFPDLGALTPPGRPTPEWEPYVLTQFDCRQYWVRDGKPPRYELQTVCLGLRVAGNRIPGGPIGTRR